MPFANAMGIYRITHVESGRTYIGSAANLRKRLNQHKHTLRQGRHHSIKLQRAWSKYGESAFSFDVIENVASKADLVAREQFWMDSDHPFFNICRVAYSPIGLHHSAESRAKRGETLKNSGRRYDVNEAIRQDPEVRERFLESMKSAERSAKISASTKKYWADVRSGAKPAPFPQWEHGSPKMYRRRCKCDVCRLASNEAERPYRAALAAKRRAADLAAGILPKNPETSAKKSAAQKQRWAKVRAGLIPPPNHSKNKSEAPNGGDGSAT